MFLFKGDTEGSECPEDSVRGENGGCKCATDCPPAGCPAGQRPVQVKAADPQTPGSCCARYDCVPSGKRPRIASTEHSDRRAAKSQQIRDPPANSALSVPIWPKKCSPPYRRGERSQPTVVARWRASNTRQTREQNKRRETDTVAGYSPAIRATELVESVVFPVKDARGPVPCPENTVLTEDGECECAACPPASCPPGYRPVQVRAALDREAPDNCCPLYDCRPPGNYERS